ncbi:heme biosynthesis protein HemY [Mucilaginibacter ginsenosidivorans]|uniref:Tetratricopeptide repeat protein n=1 Tax=Mucilaginibacter ginsenosidivorans TaxID=398053 RepID=A0A5B8V0W2_9SPHI|nr:tetratricopeptide repeat protein [Mucilaginibacter ginsenosidivorans]QEC64176.1 tetratricopeptide repeat protein [Mucilaginibacter ginsenosidivorans]
MQESRLEKLLEFLKNEPNDEFLQYALATEYLRLNNTGKALEYYEKLVTDHPGYVGTYYHLGKLYEALNRKNDAIKIYERGMEAAQKKRDNHAFAELKVVYQEATGVDDDDY